jgi:hypothetical protein
MRNHGIVLVVFCLASCSAEGEGARYDDGEATATAAEPLSNHESCATAPHDAQIDTWPGSVATTEWYGSSLCARAFIVDVTAPPVGLGLVSVYWHDALPTNATDCANATLWCYSWAGTEGLDDLFVPGTWSNGACNIPPILMGPVGSGEHSRYAISARQGSTLRSVELVTSLLGTGGAGSSPGLGAGSSPGLGSGGSAGL